jgi:hypothetical protein
LKLDNLHSIGAFDLRFQRDLVRQRAVRQLHANSDFICGLARQVGWIAFCPYPSSSVFTDRIIELEKFVGCFRIGLSADGRFGGPEVERTRLASVFVTKCGVRTKQLLRRNSERKNQDCDPEW